MAKSITIYKDGAEAKLHNRKIYFVENKEEKSFLIGFKNAQIPAEDIDKPTCSYKVLKGKVGETVIKLSEEAIEELLNLYVEYQKSKHE